MQKENIYQTPQQRQQSSDISELPTGRVPAFLGEQAAIALEDLVTERIPAISLLTSDAPMTIETTALPATYESKPQSIPRIGQWTSNPPGDSDDGIDIWPTEILPVVMIGVDDTDITIAPTRRLS